MKEKRYGQIIFIPGRKGARYPYCNSLFINDKAGVIIDPGSDKSRLQTLHREHGIDIIFNTHYHEDHTVFNHLFPEAALYVHDDEVVCHQSLDAYIDYSGLRGTDLEMEWRTLVTESFNYHERVPTGSFVDGDLFTFGSTTIQVIHTPGHTIGHCCFYFPVEEILYLGDLDLTPFGPWYGDRVSDIDQIIASVHKILRIPAKIYITSHEAGVIEGDISELVERYLAVIETRETAVLDFLDKARTFDEIVNRWIIYKKPRKPIKFFKFMESSQIRKHLERLLKNNKIKFENERFSLL